MFRLVAGEAPNGSAWQATLAGVVCGLPWALVWPWGGWGMVDSDSSQASHSPPVPSIHGPKGVGREGRKEGIGEGALDKFL